MRDFQESYFQNIRDYYGVPAKRGARVRFQGTEGTITGATGTGLLIRLDGQKRPLPYHPTWEIEYITESGGGSQLPNNAKNGG